MGDRKCPKCGGFVPAGNANCNHCGHKMFMFGGSSLYVGSSKNANKLDSKENPFSDGNKNSGCIVFIFILIILLPTIINSLGVIFEEFEKEGLTFEDIFEEDDYYYEEDDFISNNTCYNYCGDYNYETTRDFCLCSNGDIYDKYGSKYDADNSNEK